MKKDFSRSLYMPVGMICLAIAVLMDKYMDDGTFIDFIKGVLYGLSIGLNLFYIFALTNKNKE